MYKKIVSVTIVLLVVASAMVNITEKNGDFEKKKEEIVEECTTSEEESETNEKSDMRDVSGDILIPENETYVIDYLVSGSNKNITEYKVIGLETEKKCGNNFNLFDKYEENYFFYNGQTIPYSEIVDENMNMKEDYSYVLVTLRAENVNNEDDVVNDYAMGNWELKVGNHYYNLKGFIENDCVNRKGSYQLKDSQSIELTYIFIVEDKYLDSEILMHYINPDRGNKQIYFIVRGKINETNNKE